jgi:serine/threonine-protein kinase
MVDDRMLHPGLSPVPGQSGPSAPPTLQDLPADLLEASSRRLQIASLVWSALWSVGLLVNNFLSPRLDLPSEQVVPWGMPGNIVGLVGVALSLGLYGWSRRPGCDPRRLLDVGLVYEVVLALGIGLINQWAPQVLAGRLSWICVLILIHPMIAPSTPRKTLLAGVAAASMDPLGLLLARARGVELPPLSLLAWAYLPNYVCAALAVIPSHIVMRLGRQVRRARELGSYQLRELIGRGGMGEVWRAEHRLLARPAAIKLIRPEMLGFRDADSEQLALRRFRREAEAAASLQCPHTIQLYDFGVTPDRTFYFVMELLRGTDLESLVRRFGPQLPARTVYLLRQACASLAEAHANGLVHRDIKPANLFLCRTGLEYDFVKVLDFGLVKRDLHGGPEETMLTAPNTTTGTPAYIAPETVSGTVVDRRADLYALGCVGYWLLTGQLVFEADSALHMLFHHVQTKPVPPSRRSGQSLPATLEAVILCCLEKDPANRPDSAEELSARLVACDVGEPWTAVEAREWWAAHMPTEAPRTSSAERAGRTPESPIGGLLLESALTRDGAS